MRIVPEEAVDPSSRLHQQEAEGAVQGVGRPVVLVRVGVPARQHAAAGLRTTRPLAPAVGARGGIEREADGVRLSANAVRGLHRGREEVRAVRGRDGDPEAGGVDARHRDARRVRVAGPDQGVVREWRDALREGPPEADDAVGVRLGGHRTVGHAAQSSHGRETVREGYARVRGLPARPSDIRAPSCEVAPDARRRGSRQDRKAGRHWKGPLRRGRQPLGGRTGWGSRVAPG